MENSPSTVINDSDDIDIDLSEIDEGEDDDDDDDETVGRGKEKNKINKNTIQHHKDLIKQYKTRNSVEMAFKKRYEE